MFEMVLKMEGVEELSNTASTMRYAHNQSGWGEGDKGIRKKQGRDRETHGVCGFVARRS